MAAALRGRGGLDYAARILARRHAYLIVGAACVLPRLAALLAERGAILADRTEKSDDIARVFLASGTFGYVPGHPSAYTQPLYSFFLIPIYWVLGRDWAAVGLLQIAVALVAALLVYETGRRWISPRAGVVAAVIATLNPYLIWHDVHVNREILDTAIAAAIVYLTLLLVERRTLLRAALLGLVLGLAILSNTRLLLLPLVVAGFLAAVVRRRQAAGAALVVLACSALVVVPWVVRNRVEVGCFAVTTDARALWKANNANTYATLAAGGRWIDDVPALPGTPPSPEQAAAAFNASGTPYRVDECAQASFYQDEVLDFWGEHPGEKARLARQATVMLWQPRAFETAGASGSGTWVSWARRWVEPLYMVPLYALALVGVFVARRRLAVLAVALLAYNTLAAMVFAGATRYRAPFDFLLALLAAAAIERLVPVFKRRIA